MEKMSFIFFIIIVVYLIISFLKRIKGYAEKKEEVEVNDLIINKKDEKKTNDVVMAAIVATVATMMGKTPYVFKRLYLKGDVDEKKSYWKVAARNESMMKKIFFK